MLDLESLDVSKSLTLFRFVPLVEWLTMSSVSKVIQQWFEQVTLWQEACRISACRSVAHQGVNDVSCMAQGALSTIASKLQRISLLRTPCEVLCSSRFPAHSSVHIAKHNSFWMIERTDVVLNDSLIGSKSWGGGELLCAVLAQPSDHWPAGLAALVGSAVLELGAGLGLVSVAVACFCHASRMVLTDGETGCVRLAEANVIMNSLPINVETQLLRFGGPTLHLKGAFDVVIASDVAYSLELVDPLWRSVNALLRKSCGTFIVAHMDRTPSSTARLVSRAQHHGFILRHQHDLWALQMPQRHAHAIAAWLFIFERGSHMFFSPIAFKSSAHGSCMRPMTLQILA